MGSVKKEKKKGWRRFKIKWGWDSDEEEKAREDPEVAKELEMKKELVADALGKDVSEVKKPTEEELKVVEKKIEKEKEKSGNESWFNRWRWGRGNNEADTGKPSDGGEAKEERGDGSVSSGKRRGKRTSEREAGKRVEGETSQSRRQRRPQRKEERNTVRDKRVPKETITDQYADDINQERIASKKYAKEDGKKEAITDQYADDITQEKTVSKKQGKQGTVSEKKRREEGYEPTGAPRTKDKSYETERELGSTRRYKAGDTKRETAEIKQREGRKRESIGEHKTGRRGEEGDSGYETDKEERVRSKEPERGSKRYSKGYEYNQNTRNEQTNETGGGQVGGDDKGKEGKFTGGDRETRRDGDVEQRKDGYGGTNTQEDRSRNERGKTATGKDKSGNGEQKVKMDSGEHSVIEDRGRDKEEATRDIKDEKREETASTSTSSVKLFLLITLLNIFLVCSFLCYTELITDSSVRFNVVGLCFLVVALLPAILTAWYKYSAVSLVAKLSPLATICCLIYLFINRGIVSFYVVSLVAEKAELDSIMADKSYDKNPLLFALSTTRNMTLGEVVDILIVKKGIKIVLLDYPLPEQVGTNVYDHKDGPLFIKQELKSAAGAKNPILPAIFSSRWNRSDYLRALKEIGKTKYSHYYGGGFLLPYGVFDLTRDPEARPTLNRKISDF